MRRARPIALAAALAALLAACQHHADADRLLADARQYQARGEYKSAIIQLKNVLQAEPGHVAARRQLGATYLDQGDAVSAEKELRRALELGAPEEQLRPLLGKALLRQGKYQELLDSFPETAAPGQAAPVLVLRAEALLGLEQQEAARALYERALALQPDFAPALLGLARMALAARQLDQAGTLVGRALAAHPRDVDSLRLRGDVLRIGGHAEEAIAAYRAVLQVQPGLAAAHVDIANLLVDAGRFDAARAELAAARKSSAGTLALFYAQAMLDYREGKYRAALESLQQILRVAPAHGPSLLLTGAVEVALGSLALAEQHLDQYLAQQPNQPFALRLLAQVQLRNGKPEQALALLEPQLQEHPDDVALLALAGEACLRANRNERAAALFERASALQPRQPLLQAAAGLSYFRDGDTARAVAELEHAAGQGALPERAGALLVMTYLRAGQADKALAAVAALEKQADSADVQNLKGGVYLARKDVAGARRCYDKALALDPLHAGALDNLASLDLLEQHPERARARYQAALARAPNKPELYDALARLAVRTGQPAQAAGWLEQGWRANPDDLARGLRLADFYLRSGAAAKALALAQKLQGSNPANADALGMMLRAQAAAGDAAGMADTAAKLAALLPGSAGPWLSLARAQAGQQQFEAAAAAARKALGAEPGSAEAHRVLVGLLIQMKRYPEALAAARTAQQRLPALPLGWRLEGDVALFQGKPQLALPAYEKAFALNPSGSGMILVHTALDKAGRRAEADARMAQWLAAHGEDVNARLYFASAHLLRQEYRAALPELEAALKAAPDNVVALNDFAWACQQLGDPRASASAEHALRLAPDSPVVLDTLGWIRHGAGQDAAALPLLQRAARSAPQAGNIRYHLGVVLARTGDKAGARHELEQALAAGGDPARLTAARAALGKL
ncbi:MAG: XrtA/PEP-CTERM system TPR-repeat protein PrsT [Telluria sp.]